MDYLRKAKLVTANAINFESSLDYTLKELQENVGKNCVNKLHYSTCVINQEIYHSCLIEYQYPQFK